MSPVRQNRRQHGKCQIGYTRVSSVDRNNSRQLDGLMLNRVFSDYASGKDTKRPQFEVALVLSVRATRSAVMTWIGRRASVALVVRQSDLSLGQGDGLSLQLDIPQTRGIALRRFKMVRPVLLEFSVRGTLLSPRPSQLLAA
jgi:hypothetical protein